MKITVYYFSMTLLVSSCWNDVGLKTNDVIHDNFVMCVDSVNSPDLGYMLSYNRESGIIDILVEKCVMVIYANDHIFVKKVINSKNNGFYQIVILTKTEIENDLEYRMLEIDSTVFQHALTDSFDFIKEYPYPLQ